MLSESFRHVAANCKDSDPVRVLEVIERLGKCVGPNGLAGGQVMDLECEGRGEGEVSLEDFTFNNLVRTKVELIEKWKIPLKESWAVQTL